MTDQETRPERDADPSEVQPTDNSSGAPVDLERLDKLETEPHADYRP